MTADPVSTLVDHAEVDSRECIEPPDAIYSFSVMSFPDLTPWFDNTADDYEELPAAESETAYDE